MALLMVHLLAAQKWTQRHPEYANDPDFYLGIISPDAIHVRDGNDKSHKNEIHLNNWVSPHPDEVIAYWHEHNRPFDVGYGIHVLTDAQWVPRYKRLLPQILLPDGKVDVELYYRETFVTDFILYAQRGGEALFDLVSRGNVPADHPLLTQDELSQWQKMMVESYHGSCPRQGKPQFIDCDYVDAFLDDCQALFDQTYQEGFA